jgi:hypothetical protein
VGLRACDYHSQSLMRRRPSSSRPLTCRGVVHDHVAGTRAVRLAVAGWGIVRLPGRIPSNTARHSAGRLPTVVMWIYCLGEGYSPIVHRRRGRCFDWHCTYTTIPDQVFRQSYRGGELIVAVRNEHSRDDPAQYRAAWRGQWFEFHTRAIGPADGITRIFDAFRLTDTPLGMLTPPRSAAQAQWEPLRVAKQIPRIGYLTIERPTSQVVLPDFQGHLTRYGQLWRQPLGPGAQGRSRSDALVMATPTAITRLVPGPADTADPSEALAFLNDLNVTWEPA